MMKFDEKVGIFLAKSGFLKIFPDLFPDPLSQKITINPVK